MKTSAKVEQEIVIKRTSIEYIYEEDDEDFSFILIKFFVYVPGQEDLTFGSDKEFWFYSANDQRWRPDESIEVSTLYEFFGVNNYNCIHAILNDLKDNEVITAKYTISVETKKGHSLPTCGSCKHWSKGYCKIVKQNISGDCILPCTRELYKPKVTNNV